MMGDIIMPLKYCQSFNKLTFVHQNDTAFILDVNTGLSLYRAIFCITVQQNKT